MPLDAIAGLVTAVFELEAVRAVTRAFNANLPKDGPLGTIRPSMARLYARPRRYYSPTPEPRVVPRPVERPTPPYAVACDDVSRDYRDRSPPARPAEPWTLDGPCRRTAAGPFDAPWRHLPPVESPVHVQVVRRQVDLITKGTLVDLYV